MPPQDRSDYRRQAWPSPPSAATESGEPRRIGIELEFIGLPPQAVAEKVQDRFGGRLDPVSDYEVIVRDTDHGDFGVELDFGYLKERGRREKDGEGDGLEAFAEEIAEGVIALVARQLVPVEIVAPPIPMADLWQLEDVVRSLRTAGARGTKHSPHYAFGLHLNPELPALDGDTLRRYLQAFVVMYPWLMRRGAIDLSRRITPYIDSYPRAYLLELLAEDYRPELPTLIDDYLEHNPTRNRALDMLPLFLHVDADRVRAVVSDDRVKPRPTLHYRLPNCQIDEPGWQLVQTWRDFLQLDVLAHDPETLAAACAECRQRVDSLAEPLFGNWAEKVYAWVLPELL